ncbi:hypothetical protein BV25DRAFT_1919478 [Artomyces pyxidatus]|uniref:Uncharacterized protein n=1 Tax=Artomyces pyxidatus TaxID=48021 RepID=A0ACB8SPZ2_9AGAM|nr:hypothetical protein BV25DRAFT_1919478 [Artomyces pyxidatus]
MSTDSCASNSPLLHSSRSSLDSFLPSSPLVFYQPFDMTLPSTPPPRPLLWIHEEERMLREGDMVQRSLYGRDEEAVVGEYLGQDTQIAVFQLQHTDLRAYCGLAFLEVPLPFAIIPPHLLYHSLPVLRSGDAFEDLCAAARRPYKWHWNAIGWNVAHIIRQLRLSPHIKIFRPLRGVRVIKVIMIVDVEQDKETVGAEGGEK